MEKARCAALLKGIEAVLIPMDPVREGECGAAAPVQLMAIGKNRGVPHELPDGSEGWITVHPSFLLRLPDEVARRDERRKFVEDLKRIRKRADAIVA